MASRDGIKESEASGEAAPARLPCCGSWEWNPESGETVWSEETYRLYGVEPRDGAPSLPAFNPRVFVEDRPAVQKALQAALKNGAPYLAEFRIALADGSIRRLRDEGAVSRWNGDQAANVTGLVRDVTDRQHGETDAPTGESSLEQTERLADMGRFAWNVETGYLWWSDRLYRIFGLDPAKQPASFELLLQLVHPDDRERIRRINEEELAGTLHPNLEYRIRRPDGEVRHLVERYETGTDLAGRATVVRGVMQDITERKLLEERFRHSHGVKLVGNLAGSIAHEFNNLLFVILGNLELLEDLVARDADILGLIENARRGAERGSALTERMLAFSRRQYLEPEALYLNHLIPDLDAQLQGLVGDSVAIKTRLAQSLRPVFADRGQLEAALFHLAANARDALPSGGTMTIAVQNVYVGEQEAANHADAEAGAYVCLTVEDDGIGMTPEILANAAVPFFTTKDVRAGAGLGLSTVFGFVSQSGGFAKIESRPGEGAKISLYLPQSAEEQAAAETAAAAILLVEDERETRELVATYLRGLGYRVIEASDGRAARSVLSGDERIDLLFSDIDMPHGLTGPQLAETAREFRPDIKLLFMSGYREDFLLDSGQDMADVPIIWKPYDKDKMAHMVAEALGDQADKP
jgi:PAS domain S-box-containing protein